MELPFVRREELEKVEVEKKELEKEIEDLKKLAGFMLTRVKAIIGRLANIKVKKEKFPKSSVSVKVEFNVGRFLNLTKKEERIAMVHFFSTGIKEEIEEKLINILRKIENEEEQRNGKKL